MKIERVKNAKGHITIRLAPQNDKEASLLQELYNLEPDFFAQVEGKSKKYCSMDMKKVLKSRDLDDEDESKENGYITSPHYLPLNNLKERVEWLRKRRIVIVAADEGGDCEGSRYVAYEVPKGVSLSNTQKIIETGDYLGGEDTRSDSINDVFCDRWMREISRKERIRQAIRSEAWRSDLLEQWPELTKQVRAEMAAAKKKLLRTDDEDERPRRKKKKRSTRTAAKLIVQATRHRA